MDGALQRHFTGIILAVREDYQHPGHHVPFRPMPQFLTSGADRVVERGSSSGRQPGYTLGQKVWVADEILRHRGMIFESHDEAQVAIPIHCLVKKCAGCSLLK